MVELKGSLNGVGLPAVAQLIAELQHSGSLQLSRAEVSGVLGFDRGRLVSASLGTQHGLPALIACAHEFAEGEFAFVEGRPTRDHTLDLGAAELKRYLSPPIGGDASEPEPLSTGVEVAAEAVECPLLGFADDRSRHYSRPTALHRCYASGEPSLVTVDEQRQLCLSARYPVCARYHPANEGTQPAELRQIPSPSGTNNVSKPEYPPEAVSEPPPAAIEVATEAVECPLLGFADDRSRHYSRPTALHRCYASGEPSLATIDEQRQLCLSGRYPVCLRYRNAGSGTQLPGQSDEGRQPRWSAELRSRARRIVLMAGGIILGVAVLAAVFLATQPLNRGPAPKPTSVSAPAFGAVPTSTSGPLVISLPAAPTVAPTAAPTAPPTLAPTAVPTVAPTPTRRSLADIRFATGPANGWVDNLPFAGWSDGAYRLQVRQAARFVAVAVPNDQLLSDVLVAATFRKTGGPPGGGYGLIIRDQGPLPRDGVNQEMRAYVLEAGDQGEYGIWRRDRDHWVDLVPWTRSPSVRPGGSPNDLAVRAIGARLTFIINGTEVASIEDDMLSSGGVGIFAGGDYNEVALDRFTIQVPR